MRGCSWLRRLPALVLQLCAAAAAGQNGTELGPASPSAEVIGIGRRVSVADEASSALYSANAYAFIYGAPEASSVPLVVGFHTAALADYSSSQRSKLKLTVVSGIDFSGFSILDVQDVVNLPPITWLEANPTQVQFFFEQESLRANTQYELTVRATTASAGTVLGSIAVSWYSYNHAARQWVKLEESTVRQGHGTLLHQDTLAVKTAANSFTGSSVVAARTSGSSPASVLVELKMQALVTGIVSLMPFPPSAWNFSSLGVSVTDGMACPSSGAHSSALSIQAPSSAAHCFLRKRGRQVNSVDLWFLTADLSKGASVKLSLPRPQVGTLGTWYVSYREWGSSPGHLVSALPLAGSALQALGPRPHVAVEGCTSTYPGRSSVLRISFGLGANLLNLAGAFVEFRMDSSAFRIEEDGCGFRDGDSKPLGGALQTSTTANACNVSWSPSQSGTAFWSHVYTLSVAGTNAASNTTLTAVVEMLLFSGQDANSDGALDFWTTRYEGDGCRIKPPPALPSVMLYPTTVAENTKARVLLSFQTGSSARFSGEADEHLAEGMVLRLYSDHSSKIRLHKADGTDFHGSTAEAMEVDCSAWVLELWGDGDGGFPHPSRCWWDDWSQARPSIYMRFRPRNGLRMRQHYDMVFLATLALAANGLPNLVTLELRDGDGSTYLNQGSAGVSGTIVARPIRGSNDEPMVTSLEIVGGEPLVGSEIAFRAHGGVESGNEIAANNLVRLFLFPLTRWHASSCTARRSDGSLVACAPVQVGRHASALLLTLDQNSLPIGNNSDVLFTVSGVPAPAGGFFRSELGCEVWHRPRESARYMASYVTSADGRLGSGNFASAPVGGGSGYLAAHERPFAGDVGGAVHVLYRPAATCISTVGVTCQLSLTVPDGFLALSLAANSTPAHASLLGTESMPLSPASRCEPRLRACVLEVRGGSTLWAGAQYSFTVLVSNPVSPLAQDVPWNAWTARLAGAERWGLARRQEGRVSALGSAFPVLGRLGSAAVQPSALACGARALLRVQFATLQSVPSDGQVTVTAPPGFAWQESGAGGCYTFEHEGWPGSASCTVAGRTATLVPAAPLGARGFYAFSLAARLPAVAGGDRRFSIATASATSALDAAPAVSWTAQTHASGAPVFPELFDCYPRSLHTFQVSVDDMRPYSATRAPATATVRFQLGGSDVPESPIGVDVYAPAGYRWQAAGFDPRPSIPAVTPAALLLSPEWLSASRSRDANVLSLLTAARLEGPALYGFTARVWVPSATPGTHLNPTSGNGWYITIGTGAFGEEKRAASRAVVQQSRVRAISDFSLRRGTAAALATGVLSAAFTTVTSLPNGGLLRLELPAGFDFGSHLGQHCSADALRSQDAGGPTATPLPADAALACRPAAGSAPAAFEWRAGAGGIPAGRYEASVFLRNPPASADGQAAASSGFVLRSLLDGAGAVADAAAGASLEGAGGELRQAELVLAHLDARAGIFDPHPGAATWVVFAFELAEDAEPDFAMDIRAPEGFAFPSTCEVHVGDGTTYSPLGDSLTVLPPHVTRYVLFPPDTNASCLGHRREARVLVSPAHPGSRSSFPAVPGRLYLFRVRVTNPQSVPAVNKWLLRVAGQEFASIAGYDLWEFRAVSARPSYAAASADNEVALRFWSRSAIPGRPSANSLRHGLLSVRMPEGFLLRTAGAACLGFAGLRNETGGKLPSEISCEAWPGDERRLALHNRMAAALPAGQYEFSFVVRNPTFPMEALHWQLASYGEQTAQASTLLDFTEAVGFPVSARIRSFGVEPEPAGQQDAGARATLNFRLIPASEVLRGDVLMVYGPEEYNFECASGFASVFLPPPTCSGNRVVFSFLEANSSVLPRLVPFGLEGATVLTFQLGVRNPTVKPVRNVLEFLHCRGAGMDITSMSDTSGCPSGAQTVACVQHQLWQIVPQIQGMQVSLLSPIVAAQGKSSHFALRFTGVSTGAVRVRLQCPGMNFTGCLAESGGAQLAARGIFGSADVQLPAGTEVPAGAPFELHLRRVLNPAAPGPTVWAVTTLDASGAIVDQGTGQVGYTVLKLLELEPLVACQPQLLLSPETPEAQKRACTARYPWYEHGGNLVTLRFRGFAGGEIMSGHRLLIQPPAGYAFPLGDGAPLVVPLSGLSGADSDGVAHTLVTASSVQLVDARFAGQVVSVRLVSGLAVPNPFSLQVRLNNPASSPASNFWRFMLLSPDRAPMYTNDGAWAGFALHGTFFTTGHLSAVRWLVSDFPSEPNVVRLQVSLASPLAGQALKLKVTAPQGFVFDANCLPSQPDLLPPPGLADGSTVTLPWVTGCTADRSDRRGAMLELGTNLAKRTPYAVNLLITNAAVFQATALWELRTFRDNDLVHLVHYTALAPFALRVMEAAVLPEIRKYGASSLLHVSLRPQRDLGPHGQVIVSAPEGYRLFCRLRPYFSRGNLPSGVGCSGANNYAVVQLSGGDSLERGAQYQFAVRVTNPSAMSFGQLSSQAGGVPAWSVRLQTRERDLVHETTQVAGYAPASKAIVRFAVATSASTPDAVARMQVQFKLETQLVRWRGNRLELVAPSGFQFTCAEELSRNSYVLPTNAIFPSNLPRFQDLLPFLELPPARGSAGYRNEGTTEDGRAIVDCSRASVVSLAVDATDSFSFGRYAFQVEVRNPQALPVPNVWMLRSYEEGSLLEEGATGGYILTSAPLIQPAQQAAMASSGSWRTFAAKLQSIVLSGICLTLAFA